jgi:uridine kinase
VREQYYTTVRPSYEQFVAPSKQHADVIVPRGGENQAAVDVIVAYVRARLASVRH